MPTASSQDLERRNKTRHRGVSYRNRADGSRSYSVFFQGRYVAAGTTEKEALAKQAELRGKSARGERIIVASKISFGTVAEAWYEQEGPRLSPGFAKESRRALDQVLLPEWEHRSIGSLGPADLIALNDKLLKRGLSSSTVANYLKPARATLELGVERSYIAVSPFKQVKRGRLASCNTQREHREWTAKEVDHLITVGYERDTRKTARGEYGLAIEVLLRTGVRLGELLGLQYGDLQSGILHVRRQITKDGRVSAPKTTKSIRRVPVTPALSARIAARRLKRGAGDEDFVFPLLTQSNFRRRGWNPAVEDAKLDDGAKVTPHDARHALASQLGALGLSSADAAEVLGHTSSGITEKIYIHSFNREERETRIRDAMAQATGGAS
jgi:integrase